MRRGFFEREDAEAMLDWPHSGFHVHDAVLVPDGEMALRAPTRALLRMMDTTAMDTTTTTTTKI